MAVAALVTNLVLWVVIPGAISSLIARTVPGLPLDSLGFVFSFGALITGLHVLGALMDGTALSVPFVAGGHIATAVYLWTALEGGVLSFVAGGSAITLGFEPLLFLMILPLLFSAVRVPVVFLLDSSEAGLPERDIP